MKNNAWFMDLFSTTGTNCNLTSDQLQGLRYFVCTIFGKKRLRSVNDARRQTFWEKLQKENEMVICHFSRHAKVVWSYTASVQTSLQKCGEMVVTQCRCQITL